MAKNKKAATVRELIKVLEGYDPDAAVMSIEPPFETGVSIIPQTTGKIMIAPFRDV